MTDHTALIERLEKAEAGSEMLSAYVMQAVRYPTGKVEQSTINGRWCVYDERGRLAEYGSRDGWWRHGGWNVTETIDAALVLVERVLPGCGPISLTIAGSGQAFIDSRDPCGESFDAFGNTPALALCIALLKALRSQQKGER